jgi:hypothetical protein
MRELLAGILLTTTILFVSCKKGSNDSPGNNNQCASIATIKANPSLTTIEKGQVLSFQSPVINGVSYKWQTPSGTIISTAEGIISNIDFNNEGWYYLEAKNNCQETKKDSFYLDVTVPQGTASCTPADNAISFSAPNHPATSFTTVTQGETGIANDAYRLQASGGRNDLTIAFHPSYKNNKQPENGVYTTGNYNQYGDIAFGSNDYDKIFVIDITYSPTTIYYKSNPNQKVYVTRVNGKLKASICNMSFAGTSNGTPYATDITFAVVEN